uniref:G-protein coupled receptors family 3 profile domain-containing protein n=1 Tax=Ficedula albicollis TaxID=59894 RepID=A0A803VSS0_FICAL
MLFQTNDIREASVAEDVEWYQALVRSLAEGHPWVRRAVLALDAHPLAPKPRLMLQATKGDGQILLQDVSSAAPSLGNLSWDNEWFNALKAQRVPALRKRVLSNDLRSLETPKWQRGDSYVGDPGHVRWSPPFLECREGQFLPTWVVTLSSAFYGLKPDLSPEFKGVVRVDVELRDVAIDQCSSGPGWFSDTHRCDLNSTQCVPQESRSFVLGRYLCRCKPGFYGAGGVASGAWAGVPGSDGGSRLQCRPCRPGCATCQDDTPCLIQEDQVLRAAVLSCQACCMLAIFLSMLVSYHFRRSKRIRTSGIILLETILFGSLLLYFPVFILYFKPSIFRCIVLRWVRMLGFAIVYGTITLKLYRVLKVFLSRTAQRAPYVSSGRVLRMLAPILLLVLWFLAAWTIGMLENAHKNIPLVIRAQTNRGLHFSICGHDCWDYMMVIAEVLFLLWGSFLCYATRAVPSAFHEPRYMGIALHNELMVSAAFHVVRFLIVPSLHPDWTLLLFFAHTHGTITMTLALLFIPKFLHTGSPLREEITAEVYEDELDMRRSGSCMNSSIASAWSEHSLDPDDIREELKKLYRQLEVHKTWRMASNNPHLGKKRSSRRSLARSILRRGGAEVPSDTATPQSAKGSQEDVAPLGDAKGHKHVTYGPVKSVSVDSTHPPRRVRVTVKKTPPPPPVRYQSLQRSGTLGDGSEPPPAAPAQAGEAEGTAEDEPERASPPAEKGRLVTPSASSAHVCPWELVQEEILSKKQKAAEAAESGSAGDTVATSPGIKPPSQKRFRSLGLAIKALNRSKGKSILKAKSEGSLRKKGSSRREKSGLAETSAVSLGGFSPDPAAKSPERSGAQGELSPGGDSSSKSGIFPGKGGSEGDSQRSVGVGKPPELPRVAGDQAEGRRAEVCPWESREQGRSVRAEICPWDTEGARPEQEGQAAPKSESVEQPGMGLAGKPPALPKPSSQRAGTTESKKANICPWDVEDELRPKPEICPWEETDFPSGRDRLKQDTGGSSKGEEKVRSRASEKGKQPPGKTLPESSSGKSQSLERAEICPWESQDSKSSDKAEICPWESKDLKSSYKAEICPWEVTEPQLEKGTVTPKERLPAKEASKALEKGSRERELICLWESPDMEQPPAKSQRESPALPKSPSGKSQSSESLRAEICPWESQDSKPSDKAEICPWEVTEPQLEKGTAPGKERLAGKEATKGPEKGSRERDSICPWESPDMEQPLSKPQTGSSELPKSPSGKSQSSESLREEICPWESQDSKSSDKAEICPWEVAAPPSKGDKDRVSVCPWESLDTEQPLARPRTGSSELPKSPSGKSKSTESLREEICPWESQDIKSSDKSEICPWESQDSKSSEKAEMCLWDVVAHQLEKSATPEMKRVPRKQPSRALEKGSRERESISSWESPDTEKHPARSQTGSPALPKSPSGKSQSSESLREEICPWESQDLKSSDKAEICPWEVDTEQPLAKPRTGSSELPKSPSGKSKSTESLREEICPWESQDIKSSDKSEICPWESQDSKSSEKAEMCLWDVVAHQLEKSATPEMKRVPRKQPSRALEKGSRERESISSWESPDTEKHPARSQTGSPALPKSPSGKSQSSESLRAEICPWESQDSKPSDKAEICPWEGTEPQLEKGTRISGKEETTVLEKGSKERESICPWESPDTEQPLSKPQTGSSELPKSPSGKSQSSESLREEICPWESQDSKSS